MCGERMMEQMNLFFTQCLTARQVKPVRAISVEGIALGSNAMPVCIAIAITITPFPTYQVLQSGNFLLCQRHESNTSFQSFIEIVPTVDEHEQ